MTTKQAHDPVLEAELDRAMKPYNHLPRAMRKAFRDNLRRALTEDPKGKALLDRVRPPPIVTESGDVPKEGAEDAASERAVSNETPRGGGPGGGPGGGRR